MNLKSYSFVILSSLLISMSALANTWSHEVETFDVSKLLGSWALEACDIKGEPRWPDGSPMPFDKKLKVYVPDLGRDKKELWIDGMPNPMYGIQISQSAIDDGWKKMASNFCNAGGCNNGRWKIKWNTKSLKNGIYHEYKSCRGTFCKPSLDYSFSLTLNSESQLVLSGISSDKKGSRHVPYVFTCKYSLPNH